MSIRDRQLQATTNDIMEEQIKRGHYPALGVVQDLANLEFTRKPLGLPRFDAIPVEEGDVSSSEDYNKMMKNVYADLQLSFNELTYQVDKLLSAVEYYETEKNLVQMMVKRMDIRADAVMEKLSSRVHSAIIFDSFIDFSHIEFKGNDNRNYSGTDTFVDLTRGQVTLGKLKRGCKVDISKSEIVVDVLTPYMANLQLSDPKLCLKDTVNETWRQYITTNTNSEVKVEILLTLPDITEMTSLLFQSNSPKSTYVSAEYSEDGKTFQSLVPKWANTFAQWDMQTTNVKVLRFSLSKFEPDEVGGSLNHYVFGAQQISLFKDAYKERGILVSSKLPLANKTAIDTAMLKVDQVTPAGTSVRYYMAVDIDTEPLGWQEVKPNQKTDLFGMEPVSGYLNRQTLNYTDGTIKAGSNFGIDFYSIGKLEHQPAPGTLEVYIGEMWQHDSYSYTIPTGKTIADITPGLKDWVKMTGISINFMRMDQVQLSLAANKMERFTVYAYCEKPEVIEKNIIQVSDATNIKYSVYCNNEMLKPTGKNYTYYLKQGWNKIQLFTFGTVTGNIVPGIYLPEVSSRICANNRPLREVSYYDMLNNTSRNDYTRFALDSANNLVVSYNPVTSDVGTYTNATVEQGMLYSFYYKYPTVTNQSALRFMAVLSRNEKQPDITPIIKSYQIIVE